MYFNWQKENNQRFNPFLEAPRQLQAPVAVINLKLCSFSGIALAYLLQIDCSMKLHQTVLKKTAFHTFYIVKQA